MSVIQNFSDTYEILDKLGEGAGGIVYKAYHKRLRQEVVIKQHRRRAVSLTGSRREVDILKNLHHSYLPQVLDFFEIDGDVYTVMSYVPGKSFAQLLAEGYRFTPKDLIRWGIFVESMKGYLQDTQDPNWGGGNTSSVAYNTASAVQSRHVVLPIPSIELGVNSAHEQNPLW